MIVTLKKEIRKWSNSNQLFKKYKGGWLTESNLTIEREIGVDSFLIISLWLFFELDWKVDQRIEESVRGCFILKTQRFKQTCTFTCCVFRSNGKVYKEVSYKHWILVNFPDTNNGHVCSVNNNSCNTELGSCLRENLIGFQSIRNI